jgi:hypothetical protein
VQIIETAWRMPVTVRLQSGLEHNFHSVEDTIDFLENEWPTKSGKHFERALDMCRQAAARVATTEAAREAFISACYEAKMRPAFSIFPPTDKQPLIVRFQ